jgi:hypothetical protein
MENVSQCDVNDVYQLDHHQHSQYVTLAKHQRLVSAENNYNTRANRFRTVDPSMRNNALTTVAPMADSMNRSKHIRQVNSG